MQGWDHNWWEKDKKPPAMHSWLETVADKLSHSIHGKRWLVRSQSTHSFVYHFTVSSAVCRPASQQPEQEHLNYTVSKNTKPTLTYQYVIMCGTSDTPQSAYTKPKGPNNSYNNNNIIIMRQGYTIIITNTVYRI